MRILNLAVKLTFYHKYTSSVQFSSVHVILKFHIIQLQAKLIKKIQNTHKRLQHTETNKHKELLYKGIS